MSAVSTVGDDVGLFELCNPHLLATDLLQVILELISKFELISKETAPPLASTANRTRRSSSPGQNPLISKVACNFLFFLFLIHYSFRPQRRKRRRGDSERLREADAVGILIEGNSEQQKSAEEKLKERLKAKFGDTHAREEGESSSKRPKITWP